MIQAPHPHLIGALLLGLLALISEPHAARARTVVIEDAGTSILEPVVALRWKSIAPTHGAGSNQMVGVMTVRLRLNLAPWLHRSAHIYLSLPRQQPGPMQASWTAQEHLMPGQVQSGNRVLVYSGPITSAVLEDTLRFEFTIDGRLVQRAFPVSVQFEMDGA
jgi:hypothetical protein